MTDERLLTPEEVSEYLGIAVKTLKNYLRDGKITGVKVGSAWRIKKEDLDEFVAKNTIAKK